MSEADDSTCRSDQRGATKERPRSAAGAREEIKERDEKEDRLLDRFDGGDIDRGTYDRQLARLRAEKDDEFEKLRAADATSDDAYLVTAQRVLELAKSGRTLWNGRSPEEKRDLLNRLVCNPRLDERTVRYDLQKHFAALAQMRGEGGWRPQGDSTIAVRRVRGTAMAKSPGLASADQPKQRRPQGDSNPR